VQNKTFRGIFVRRAVLSAVAVMAFIFVVGALPHAFAQSPEVSSEWGLFNQILFIGILVGLVVFGLMFYAIIRYRERPGQTGAK